MHKAIFPAIVAAKKAEDAGQPQQIAIAESVPGLVEAMSKTMACKEMCEAAVTSCSCKQDGDDVLTFGEAIENAEKVEDGFKQVLHPTTDCRALCSVCLFTSVHCCVLWCMFTCSCSNVLCSIGTSAECSVLSSYWYHTLPHCPSLLQCMGAIAQCTVKLCISSSTA